MFEYDQESNRLRLKGTKDAPWMKRAHFKDPPKKWLYCYDCKTRYIKDSGAAPKTHLPYRDRSSQLLLRPNLKKMPVEKQASSSQGEQEPEPDKEPDAVLQEEEQEQEIILPVEVAPPPRNAIQFPTLEEYEKGKRNWQNIPKTLKEIGAQKI